MVKIAKIEEALKTAQQKGPAKLVLIYGPDAGLNWERLNLFRRETLKRHPELEYRRFSEDDLNSDFAGFETAISHSSLFGGANIGLLRLNGDGQTAKIADLITRIDSSENGIAGALFIDGGDLTPNSRIVSAFDKSPNAWAIRQFAPTKNDLTIFIRQKCETEKVKITNEAIEKLLNIVPNDVNSVLAEIENLALYVGIGGNIDIEAIDAISSGGRDAAIDEIINSALLGERRTLSIRLNQALENGQSPILIFNALIRRLKILLNIHKECEDGKAISNIVAEKRMGIFWKEQTNVAKQAQTWSRKATETAISRIIEADILSKTRDAPVNAILERLLNSFCNRAAKINT